MFGGGRVANKASAGSGAMYSLKPMEIAQGDNAMANVYVEPPGTFDGRENFTVVGH